MILMRRNIPVAKLHMDNGIPIRYEEIYSKEDLPLGTTSLYKQNETILLNKWYKSRVIPNLRVDLGRLCNVLGKEPAEMFYTSAGVSITDTYWFYEENSNVLWKDVNYHDNGFDPVFQSYYLNCIFKDGKTPDFTTDGIMEKFWYISNDIPFLAKLDREYNNLLIANEVVYSKIASYHNINVTPYYPGKTNDLLYCSCPCFVHDADHDFVTAMQVKHSDFSLSGEKLINYFCNNLGFQNEVKQMITLDCILHNTDRHEKNFGYLIDSNKNCSFVPLFDNGFCLGANRVASDYVDKVNDFDMKILSGSRFDILSKYGVSIDFDESYALQVIKDAYEYYAVPEEQYEIAKAEIQFSTKTLAQLKSEILVETELDINI